MLRQRPALFTAIAAGVVATSFAFFSPAGADDLRAEKAPKRVATAVFAGGCFWCVEADFDKLDGVLTTESGYTGGHLDKPTYKQVVRETTGHYEAVKVTYDPDTVTYDVLAGYFIRHIDPLDAEGQFCDKGASYRSAIFVSGAAEREVAEKIVADAAETLGSEVATKVIPSATFWPAETYHQDYYRKNPVQYGFYRNACGRDARVKALWDEAPKAGH